MERRPVSIPRAEIPAEAIRYSDVRTRVEIASEVTPIVNFRNANMRVLYEDLGMSSISIGRAVGLSTSRTVQLLHRQGVVMRDVNDPIYAERRIAGIKDFYTDPVKAADWVTRVHTPEVAAKRGNALSQKYKTDSEYRTRRLGFLESAWAANRIAGEKRRAEKANQVSEQVRLEREREARFARKLLKRPEIKMLSPRQRQVIELRFRTDGGPNLSLEQVGEVLGGLSRQAIQQYEAAALIKLGVLKKPRNRSSSKIGG